MLLIKTAFKNIIGNGKRTWLNVSVLSLTLVIMIAFYGIIDGWLEEARLETIEWETGAGQLHHPEYDRFDVFTLHDAHGNIPNNLNEYINSGSAIPVLVMQGSIYPQGRMLNILVRGIPITQKVLKLPTSELIVEDDAIPCIIGKRAAKSADLKTGDRVMLRWRDKNGVFDAREIVVSHIFETKVPSIDAGQIWIDIEMFYQMTGMESEATYFILSENCPVKSDLNGWHYKSAKFLMADLDLMEQTARSESVVIFIILLSIGLLAVFDTQVLSIFRRQKEIGTYVALGMTPKKVTQLFTIEGTTYSILAVLVAIIWGTPVLYWISQTGWRMPAGFDDIGIAMGNALYPVYKFSSISYTILAIIIFSAIVSYIPARKIAKQNMVEALKGKIN